MASKTDDHDVQTSRDAARAVRFLALKAAVFIAVPLLAGVAVALVVLQ